MTTDKSSHTRHSSDPDYMDSQSRPPLTPTHSKPRRPLPVPGEQQHQQHQPKAIPASFFYGNENKSASPHAANLGSAHTNYIAPSTSLPSHHNSWKEPESAMDDDTVPPLVPVEDQWGTNQDLNWTTNEWDPSPPSGAWGSPNVVIDGRSEEEEVDWCDVEVRERNNRPGPGLLPPSLADLLHNPDHTLYFVKPSPPLPRQASTSPTSTPAPATPHFLPPTAEEVRMAVPHPNAYYCKEHNGWVLLQWCSSTILPTLAKSFTSLHPLPDQTRRKRSASCLDGGEQQYGRVNRTHHFHRYEKAVDARCLTIPYKRNEWEVDDQKKLKHRKATLIDIDVEPRESETSMQGEREDDEPEGDLLDLYVCCQCSTYCLVSEVLPGVIPVKYVDEFTRDKLSHPALDKTPKATVLAGWETVLTIVENRLWKGETRVLPVTRPKFQTKLGWNQVVRHIFDLLGFTAKHSPIGGSPEEQALHPANIDISTVEGTRNRAKLIRAWVELSAWLAVFHRTNPKSSFGDYNTTAQVISVSIENAREMYQTGIGAHVNQIPRGQLPPELVSYEPLDHSWTALGMTPSSYTPDLLLFAYFAQCRCDPVRTIEYFTHIHTIYETMTVLGVTPPEDLQTILISERSRNRFITEDIASASAILGFGKDNELRVELDHDVDDQFIIDAWKNGLKRAWREDNGSQRRSDLNDAFRIIGDARGSRRLRKAWKEERGSGMSPDTAYNTLEVPRDVDEAMILAIYALRVTDQPHQSDKMREALSVIADFTDSQRLRQFLETGTDPGDLSLATTQDMPRGLNQLGNTCYLNSLLQYFYTIKDLRAAVAPLANTDAKSFDDSKFTDDDLKRHRVGGRLVTRREILRSKKFVNQLADLFWNMEYCEVPAVTPTIDLAKLALVTSQDEEEDDQEKAAADTSDDTDATLVEDAPPRAYTDRSSKSPVQSSSFSILGKRNRNRKQTSPMDLDDNSDTEKDKEGEGYVLVSKPSSPRASGSPSPPEPSGSTSKKKTVDQDGDVEMRDPSKPPPLPPRKPREVDDSAMMFGRQHDVSECMDNCMFQIETALLDFQGLEGAEADKTSVVKRLFYGKKKQKLTPLMPDSRRQPTLHEKEDLFSHLHVNVSEEGYDLYDGLSRYFDDVVEFEGVKRRMEVSLIDLPPLLQIQLQRVQFDRETQQAYKSQAYVKFGETIYLDRFMDSADPDKKARSKAIHVELDASRDRIQRMTVGKHAPFDIALGGSADFLSKQDLFELSEPDQQMVTGLRTEQDYVKSLIEQERANVVRLKAELEELWKNDTEAAYELTSVFVHRGSSPSWGHYFFYSRHLPDNPDSWFKYNDSDVSVVAKDEVLGDTTGSTANPYMLVFSKKGTDVIHTVHRFDPENLLDG